jgi:hypothetical protein
MKQSAKIDPSITKSRVVRVFVSSTFRDMQQEREQLVKFIFPELRRRCRERGVQLVEVDLRWGITEEQAERGEVLPICLAEIENCRPYFIGLKKKRYGWVRDETQQHLVDYELWSIGHGNDSAADREILRGVLRNPEIADYARYGFRVPFFIDSLPDEKAREFLEGPMAESQVKC